MSPRILGIVLASSVLACSAMGGPLGDGFSYQGNLSDGGVPVDDTADFEFALWDASVGGNQVGVTDTENAVLVSEGLFTVELNFGYEVFEGQDLWLEINVRSPSGVGVFEPLGARQRLSATAYSLQTRGVFVDDALNVGVGTTSPLHKLHVSTDAGTRALYSEHTVINGTSYGVWGRSTSTRGYGVFGDVTASTGTNYGVRGDNSSNGGRGVQGYASSTTGVTFGMHGTSDSVDGVGVYGRHSRGSGTGAGVVGVSNSISAGGVGVLGEITSIGPGVGSVAVRGIHNGAQNNGIGVWGSQEGGGTGVFGTSQRGHGVHGVVIGGLGSGVYGEALDHMNTNAAGHFVNFGSLEFTAEYGARGEINGGAGSGVYGISNLATGFGDGVHGKTFSSDFGAYGVFSTGNMGATGVKSFVQPDPENAGQEIRFVCLEGNESGTYFRGSGRLENGRAYIEVPEEFRKVSEGGELTVQVTAMGPGAGLWIESKDLDTIVVVGNGDVEFDYFVNGIRRGYKDLELVSENTSYVPSVRGVPFGTQYPEGLRRVLVESGILNADFTPNEETAKRMGWDLREPTAEELGVIDVGLVAKR